VQAVSGIPCCIPRAGSMVLVATISNVQCSTQDTLPWMVWQEQCFMQDISRRLEGKGRSLSHPITVEYAVNSLYSVRYVVHPRGRTRSATAILKSHSAFQKKFVVRTHANVKSSIIDLARRILALHRLKSCKLYRIRIYSLWLLIKNNLDYKRYTEACTKSPCHASK
jgi:hypothetical protein